jgi:transposase
MPRIFPKRIKNHVYYYYQETYRVKIDPSRSGKTKGSGRSKVCTKSVCLGTAQSVYERLTKLRRPIEVVHREFGMIAAGYQVAQRIGLTDALRHHIPGSRFGIPRWVFFMVAILNRLDAATSKEQMGKWASKTVLPQLLNFDPETLNSKTFWYVTDDVISERELRERRQCSADLAEELCVGLDTRVFEEIEKELWPQLFELLDKSVETLIYDTTNFFTYIEEPVLSLLAKAGHNKASKHHLKQVGLALLVDREWGIPLFHQLYRGNSQDANTFSMTVSKMLDKIKTGFCEIAEMVLVIDKGNNSVDNFAQLKGRIRWVGSLTPSNYKNLVTKELIHFNNEFENCKYYKVIMTVMGAKCIVVVTYHEKLYRKQVRTFESGIKKLRTKLIQKFNSYKTPQKKVSKGLQSLQVQDHYCDYIDIEVIDKKLVLTEQEAKIREKKQYFGKNLIFSDKLDADPSWIITQYKKKEKIEDDFKVLKSPDIIRFRPMRHWTDTKMYAYGFCCIMALILIRVMNLQAERIGLTMSPSVLKEELKDIKEVIMVYGKDSAQRQLSRRSPIQDKLWKLFDLEKTERQLTIHNKKT